MPLHQAAVGSQWWKSGVIYQIYPRSFADANNDGMGDLPGITQRLPKLKELGVDAVWLSPFYTSPQKDAGYDVANYRDVDPLFGTLEDFDQMVDRAHELGLRVMIDLVPNHSSDQHVWFQNALNSEKGSKERSYYHFKDGKGENGELPPNNWQSMFGGPAWTRIEDGQWYCHLFDSSQPDLNWENQIVRDEFEDILKFWLDRGVDGFRVDQPHAMGKEPGLPDHPYVDEAGAGFIEGRENPPMWFQDSVHEIFRSWRKILESYPGERAMCGEAYVLPLSFMAQWVRSDEFHQTFNFRFLDAGWDKDTLVAAIDESFEAFDGVGAPSTWVLNNHDVMRHASRFGGDYGRTTASDGVGPENPQPNNELGIIKARAATLFMLALPGASYLYQGEELGLPEHTTIQPEFRQDPTFFRTSGQRVGRDGCRVPLPWEDGNESNGFNESGKSWLPQPQSYAALSRDSQETDSKSTLNLYKAALKLRADLALGEGSFDWVSTSESLSFVNNGILVVHNFSNESIPFPDGEVLLTSSYGQTRLLPNTTAWIRL
ncbi:MAG: glycoside hydrolase family 13 protein [Aquiluna sp.]|nr:glycoside hydrolase family 13 protein [Aquiluna sp.]MCF8545514.1 glycoside hydrolase family 13 protein [Aquiluna sp.]